MDSIFINELQVPTHIGITPDERAKTQTLNVSLELFTDTSKAGASDDIEDTIDYDRVAKTVRTIGQTERNTIEKFAEDTAQMILRDFKPKSVKVSVWKYVLPDAKGVAVTITRP